MAAALLAKTLHERGIRLESVVDEGGGVPRLRIPGVISKMNVPRQPTRDFVYMHKSQPGSLVIPPKQNAPPCFSAKPRIRYNANQSIIIIKEKRIWL
ncbi:MAG: hypothetical protein ACSW70_03090 [Eubacteriales bacterium]